MMLALAFIVTLVGHALASPALKVISFGTTSGGFDAPARGWNSFGIQANNVVSDWKFDQAHVQTQCDVLSSKLSAGNYTYCSLDSGWSMGSDGDSYGRIIPDTTVFPNLAGLAAHLHSSGLQLGVYVVPGGFIADTNKTIYGTSTKIGSVCTGDNGLKRCNWDYSQGATQQWFNSVANQFASWGIDFIKLDYITPGSPSNGVYLRADASGEVIAWRKAIDQCGRKIRLDISWKLDRSQKNFAIWNQNADSMRTDQDINNSGSNTFVAWATVQRAIENYRQWISAGSQYFSTINVRPDLDNLYASNEPSISGISYAEQQTMMSHWIGAGANLILGDDLTRLNSFGTYVLTHPAAQAVTSFTAKYPMQPRNPGSGGNSPKQVQAWIAGPSPSGEAVVLLVNYGPDQGQGGFGTKNSGSQHLVISYDDLGVKAPYRVFDVWNDNYWGDVSTGLSVNIAEGQSFLLHLTRP
ncbi:hypothetical protein QQS21_002249 [Conoideocrella luteorostrata]|uniref:Alpha-galactosidase n=1 Tax=Conoideocrella luteorostrata TaxID=1105319 RepID=A0AAJ0FWQ1_9HYPO|nr:hypothetical protein QQS21_002249 [Conoideocrella luteorostrata]